MKKVVGLGACVLDTLINCDKYPREDTKQKSESIFLSGGGPVGNALVVMSKLGIKTDVIGAFADDNAGMYLLEDFQRYKVGIQHTIRIPNTTSFTSYIVLAENTQTRTCVFDRGTVPDNPENVCFYAIDDATVLHLDGNYLESAIAAAKYAKEKGVKVSLDAGGLYQEIERLLPYVDLLIPSAEFAKGITGKTTIAEAMQMLADKYKPEILVVTDGSNGGYYWENGKAIHYESVKVKALDTNGAGDTFHGAFVVAYCNGKSVKDCCKFASAVAAYKCMHVGARTYPLKLSIVEEFIATCDTSN